MKQGTLFYDKDCGRYNFKYEQDGDWCDYGGIHSGEVFEFCLNDVWVPARVEMANDWYLVGLPVKGKKCSNRFEMCRKAVNYMVTLQCIIL